MSTLIIGLLVFFLAHSIREFGLRPRLLDRVGSEGAFKGLYSVVSLLGLILIAFGKASADFVMLWQPPFELRWVSGVLMIPAFILVVAGNLPATHLARALGHPMLLGTCLWGVAHLWSNGDLSSLLLFGGFALWAAVKFFSLSKLPSGTGTQPRLFWDLIALIVGCVLYALVFVFHGQLFGVGLNFA